MTGGGARARRFPATEASGSGRSSETGHEISRLPPSAEDTEETGTPPAKKRRPVLVQCELRSGHRPRPGKALLMIAWQHAKLPGSENGGPGGGGRGIARRNSFAGFQDQRRFWQEASQEESEGDS